MYTLMDLYLYLVELNNSKVLMLGGREVSSVLEKVSFPA
jgi:hypothetical protein